MKKISAGLGAVLCAVAAVLATGWWVYVDWFSPEEASYLVRSESLFGALLWWMVFLFAVGGFPSVNGNGTETSNHAEATKTTNQPKDL